MSNKLHIIWCRHNWLCLAPITGSPITSIKVGVFKKNIGLLSQCDRGKPSCFFSIDWCILEISARKAQPMAFNATDKGVEQFICEEFILWVFNQNLSSSIPMTWGPSFVFLSKQSQFSKRSTVKSLHKSCFLPTVIEMDLSMCFHFQQGLCLFSSSL